MSHAFYIDPLNWSGGLELWWNDEANLNVISWSKNLIIVDGKHSRPSTTWAGCFVYAPHEKAERLPVWNLINQANVTPCPFLIISDFNLVENIADKQGGNSNILNSIEEFQNFLSEAKVVEVLYTWSNNREDEANIRERIDRALVNCEWMEIFPVNVLKHNNFLGSDHSPLTLSTTSNKTKARKCFKFEAMWTQSNECEITIRDTWTSSQSLANLISSDAIKDLQRDLSRCASNLQSWAKHNFGNNRKIIEQLTMELTEIQSYPTTSDNCSRAKQLTALIEETWLREEIFLHQRSRINCLRSGDQNTRFFHLSTIHRGQRNQIVALNDGHGQLVENPAEIKGIISSHFENIFNTYGPRNMDDTLSVVSPLVSESMNRVLIGQVSSQEIVHAVKQLGSLKAPGEDGFPGIFFKKY